MTRTFNQRLRRTILFLLIGFVALFVFRLIFGYTKTIEFPVNTSQIFSSANNLRKNYASKKYSLRDGGSGNSGVQVDQKYEKIADINTQSSQFEQEENKARKLVEQEKAIIQFEQKSGNKGNRKLNLQIGVPPENFDSLYNNLIKIGSVQAKQITKNDKTNEYKQLNARKTSLEKIRNSLIELKDKGGKINEYMQLENRVLEIEQELQTLGVSLGDFDDENEFCTIKFSMSEGKEVKIGLMQRVKVALEWTVKVYLQIMVTLFFLSLFAYIILLIIDKLKLFEKIFKQNQEVV